MPPVTRSQKKKALAAAPPPPAINAADPALLRPPPVIDPNDRLSNLHSEIQARILSFLPAHEAMRSCVLARTWRDSKVWNLTRRLLITAECVSVQDVRGFVDRLLDGLKDHGPIDACEIGIRWEGEEDDDDDVVDIQRLILRVLDSQAKSLGVRKAGLGYLVMRNASLVSPHLTRLEFYGLRFFSGNDCLNLSGCPALEHLKVECCDLFGLTKVMSPSVKRLVMESCSSGHTEYDRLQICFPRLVSLSLRQFFDNTPVLESMPQLWEAYVNTGETYSEAYGDYGRGQYITKSVVLEGLAQAKHLVLLSDNKTYVFRWDLRFCPTFSNLKTLKLDDYWCESADCSELSCILEHAPVLEKLTVVFDRMGFERDVLVKGSPNATGKSTMISQHLKIVELECSELHQSVHKRFSSE